MKKFQDFPKEFILAAGWMGAIGFSEQKLKPLGSMIAISVIELLKDYIELSNLGEDAEVGQGPSGALCFTSPS